MSQDEQQHRGGFVPVGELADTLPGFEARGRAMSAQARHHFTTLHQSASWRGTSNKHQDFWPIYSTKRQAYVQVVSKYLRTKYRLRPHC